MRLTKEQIDRYDRDGFLVFPELFAPAEVAALRGEVDRVSRLDAEGIVREGEGGRPKIMLRMHERDGPTASPEYRAFACQSRTLGVARQLLRDDALYLHHSKVNLKAAIEGSAWPWHQDFGTWHLDGIARPAMTTVMLMLDDSTEMNGCLYFLPGSHRANRQVPYWDDSTAYQLWAVGPERMCELMAKYPSPVPVTGRAGTVAILHCNLLHASGYNLSANDRRQAYLCYNQVANHPHEVENPRPDYVRSLNWNPLELMPDDAILATAREAA